MTDIPAKLVITNVVTAENSMGINVKNTAVGRIYTVIKNSKIIGSLSSQMCFNDLSHYNYDSNWLKLKCSYLLYGFNDVPSSRTCSGSLLAMTSYIR